MIKSEIKEVKNSYKKKLNDLKKFNHSYYNNDKSLISDADYDLLKKEINNLEKKYIELGNLSQELVGAPLTNKFNVITSKCF